MNTEKNKRLPVAESHSAGRIVIDSRGRNVWQWNDDQLDSTSIMLKRLENSELALEPTRKLRRPETAGPEKSQGQASAAAGRRRDERPERPERPEHTQRLEREPSRAGLKIEQTFEIDLGSGSGGSGGGSGSGFDPYNRS